MIVASARVLAQILQLFFFPDRILCPFKAENIRKICGRQLCFYYCRRRRLFSGTFHKLMISFR